MTNRPFGYHLKRFILLPVISLFLLVNGCATNTDMLATLDSKTVLTPDQGIVVVRVINATDYPLPMNQVTIAPDNLNESENIKFQRLSDLDLDLDDSTVFASPVKAGNYAMSSIRSLHFRGEIYYEHYAFAGATFGTFKVAPGKVTDLGTVIYYHKPQQDKYLKTLIRVPESGTGEVLQKYFPFYNFSESDMLGWTDDGRNDDRETTYLTVAQNPTVFEDAYKAPDGSLYFLGKLGVIVIRTPDGEWVFDAVDTNLNLNTIAQNENGDLITGGEEGKLFWKPKGSPWQDISLGHDVSVTNLSFHENSYVDMITKSDSLLTISRAEVAPQLNWQEFNRYTSRDGWKLTNVVQAADSNKDKKSSVYDKKKEKPLYEISRIELHELDGTHYINVSTISSYANRVFTKGDREKFAYYPDSWKVYVPEKLPEVTTMISAGTNKLGVTEAGFWSWTGRPTVSRYDSATSTWQEISTSMRMCPDGTATTKKTCDPIEGSEKTKSSEEDFNLISIPVFSSELEALTIVNFQNTDFWTGKRSNDFRVLKTIDGGKTWQDTNNKPPNEYCAKLVTEVSDRLLVTCSGATGDFYESYDEGKTWKNVRQQMNF